MYQLKQTRKILGLILIVLAATFSIASLARAAEPIARTIEPIHYISATLAGEYVNVKNTHTTKEISGLISIDMKDYNLEPGTTRSSKFSFTLAPGKDHRFRLPKRQEVYMNRNTSV